LTAARRYLLAQDRAGLVAKAADHVIIDQARRLHVRIDDSATDKPESAFLEVLRKRV
jgi:hypothetical protein